MGTTPSVVRRGSAFACGVDINYPISYATCIAFVHPFWLLLPVTLSSVAAVLFFSRTSIFSATLLDCGESWRVLMENGELGRKLSETLPNLASPVRADWSIRETTLSWTVNERGFQHIRCVPVLLHLPSPPHVHMVGQKHNGGAFRVHAGAFIALVRCTNMFASLAVARFSVDIDTSWLCAFTVRRPTACTTEVSSQMLSASCAQGCCPGACEAQSHTSERMLPVLR